ncbi:hypothetical protein DM01DRAFT_1363362 [Hesseltinella vesiculosa]|uniref:Proteasome assembly chaperone 2 n=1 Tax=Hesseltinella vesiculosa TaxID=101127 RepID=A0A1X2GEG9_9FUNG|nr:hypothetical protein DM01DRAFT_1363362 [Hesseltinella vesiculosa]
MSCLFQIPSFDPSCFKGSHLFLPSVSIGNVPQLTCDLLIHTLKLNRVGFIESDALIPVIGQRENSDIGVHVPIEVYQSADQRVTVVQQRSPTLRGRKKELVATLIQFITSNDFSRVTLVTSLDASMRLDSQITRYIAVVKDIQQQIGVPVLETSDQEETAAASVPMMSGGGLARSLYQQLSENAKMEVVVFSMFVLEGDNVQDSVEMANVLNSYYSLLPQDTSASWTPPKSWEFLFGTPFNKELYQ